MRSGRVPVTRIDAYEILEKIGSGGTGEVYKALHPRFRRYVALKVSEPDALRDTALSRRFARDTELLARLPSHPNIVAVLEALIWENRFCVAMEYVEGETLADAIRHAPIPPRAGAKLLDQILSALDALHTSGIVHRDLKPGNVLVDREGTARVCDFGLASFAEAGAPDWATPKYAAPEVVDPTLGRGASPEQGDLYSAGILAYEMLLGRERFRDVLRYVYNGTATDTANRWLRWHVDRSRTAPYLSDIDPTIPIAVSRVVGRLMAKDVNERYRRAEEARRDLESARFGERDARRRRDDVHDDDMTTPLPRDRSRPITRPLDGEGSAYVRTPSQSKRDLSGPPPHGRRRFWQRMPAWGWILSATGLVAIASLILIYLFSVEPGFALVVRGAPPGSEVYVDGELKTGSLSPDGLLTVKGLEPGTRQVAVAHTGYERFTENVTGADGEFRQVNAVLRQETKIVTPAEIEYTGPMLLVGAGDFLMGDDSHLASERPAHLVTLPDFYIDKYEVTNAQYRRFCEATGRKLPSAPLWDENYMDRSPQAPVVGVTWEDARAYAEWAGKRLPTEEEWEKAASWDAATRTKRMWPWGSSADAARARYASDMPVEVGKYESGKSPYGAYDMAGNVLEWVDGTFEPYAGSSASADPQFGQGNHVARGGQFGNEAEDLRTTRRFWHRGFFSSDEITQRTYVIGFRCAVSADDPRVVKVISAKQ